MAASCTKTAGDSTRTPQPTDTLYTTERALAIYSEQPQHALQIIDSAEVVGNASDFTASLLRARVHASTGNSHNLDTAMRICSTLLRHDSVRLSPQHRYSVLEQLTNICRLRADNEQYLHYAIELADLCREQGRYTDALRTEAEIGVVQTYLGHRDEGLARIDRAIGQLDGQRHFNELDATIIALKRKIRVLDELNRPADIIPVAQRIIERLDDYEQHPDQYADGSHREPVDDNDRASYINFYRAQAIGFLAGAYALMGDLQQARHYTDLFEQTPFAQTCNGRTIITTAWLPLGEYDKLLDSYDMQQQQMGTDTLNADYATILRGRAIVAAAQGRHADSQDYWQRYADVSQAVAEGLLHSQAQEYAARYHDQELRLKLEQQETRVARSRAIAQTAVTALLAALIALLWYMRQKRIISRKNHALAEQIAKAITFQDKYESTLPTTQKSPNEMTDAELFDFLSGEILHHRLYLDADFERQTLTERYHITDHRIGAAFSQSQDFTSLPDFIRDCRLRHACRLLTDSSAMPISEVITASGFNNSSVFSRDFKAKYGITPTAYRKQNNA